MDLGWVDFIFCHSTVCPVQLGQMETQQNWLGSMASLWNFQIEVNPDTAHNHQIHTVFCTRPFRDQHRTPGSVAVVDGRPTISTDGRTTPPPPLPSLSTSSASSKPLPPPQFPAESRLWSWAALLLSVSLVSALEECARPSAVRSGSSLRRRRTRIS